VECVDGPSGKHFPREVAICRNVKPQDSSLKQSLLTPNLLLHQLNLLRVELVERNPNPNGVALVNPDLIAKKSYTDLEELAKENKIAGTFIQANTSSKLELLAEQLKFLQQQALNVLQEAENCSKLHKAACNFVKMPGKIYHLYERPSGQLYFSMLSPQEWNDRPPHEFKGSYRLENDMSWTPAAEVLEKQKRLEFIEKSLQAYNGQLSWGFHEKMIEND